VSILTVQLFASYAEAFGGPTLEIPFESGATVADLVRSIRSLPGGRSLPASPRIAVNRKFAAADQLIRKEDEVAVVPPVAGG
jgi:molybdopterin converting factor small subunit